MGTRWNHLGGGFNEYPQSTGLPRSGKKSGKRNFFQVREMSGNLGLSQGKSQKVQKSGKSQGISKFSQKVWSLAMYQCQRI